ncbi:MAG: zinc-binding dehydrogenase [Eubacteriales bacterium]
MKSYTVQKDGSCAFTDLPKPRCGQYDALVKIEACGVCNGTDTKIIHRKFKGVDDYPVVLGHEGVGRVVELGEKVRSYRVGDLVLMPYLSDLPEGWHSAWGTFAEYNTVTDAKAMEADGLIPPEFAWSQQVIPADFDPVSSTMIITFREVLSTMRLFGFEENKSVAVLGLGPVGLSFVKLCSLMGMGPVVAIDISEDKLRMAKDMGAHAVINSKTSSLKDEVRRVCPEGLDFALDAVGVPSFISEALGLIKPNAKVCVYGISERMDAPLDWSSSPYNWTLQFNQFPSKKAESLAHNTIINWIKLGLLNPSDYISHVFDFEDIAEAFEKIEKREPIMKMVIKI